MNMRTRRTTVQRWICISYGWIKNPKWKVQGRAF